MAILTDHTKLNQGTEIVLNKTAFTIQLLVAGNLTSGGVTLDCVYSALKGFWKNDATLPPYPFPMQPITSEQFDFTTDAGTGIQWNWADTTTRNLVKTGGWSLKNSAGVSQEEWGGIVSLGSIGSSEQPCYNVASGGASTNFAATGPINQAVKLYGDATHGNFDYRSYFKVFVRTQGNTYATAQLSDIGVTTATYNVMRFPLSDAVDAKITDSDVTVSGFGITCTWYTAAQSVSVGGTNYNFHVLINGNNKTAEQIYEGVQWLLRKTTNINSGTGTGGTSSTSYLGNVTNELVNFVGNDLYTQLDGTGGVYIQNTQTADINRIHFTDDTGTIRTPPFVAALTLQFGANLVNDAAAIYRVYFTSTPSGSFGTSAAVLVNNASSNPMSGNVSGSTSLTFTYAYDSDNQGGRTPGTDAAITVVAIGLATAQYVLATGVIGRNTTNSVSLAAPLERNYV